MISITIATANDFNTIEKIARQTWPEAYGTFLSAAQLNYMLDAFYSEETLLKNLTEKNHHFLLYKEDGETLGFASYEHYYKDERVTRIHKLYLLPDTQGKGIGKQLIDEVVKLARENQMERLTLNVNRYNKAQYFYLKYGFEIVKEEDIEIGNGYLMEDYVMQFYL